MHGEPIHPHVAALLNDVRAVFGAGPVEPDARLLALFQAAPSHAVSAPARAPRRPRMLSDLLTTLPAKIAAGFVGATLAWGGLGVAGAVPGPLTLSSADDEVEVPAPEDGDGAETTENKTEADGGGDEALEESGSDADDAEDSDDTDETVETEDAEDGDDAELPDVPTSVSEAAHTHDFDDDCGNHGAYVSHFARTGEEPDCATRARAEAAEEAGDGNDAGDADTTETADADSPETADAETDARKGKAKAKAAKGKGAKAKTRR